MKNNKLKKEDDIQDITDLWGNDGCIPGPSFSSSLSEILFLIIISLVITFIFFI